MHLSDVAVPNLSHRLLPRPAGVVWLGRISGSLCCLSPFPKLHSLQAIVKWETRPVPPQLLGMTCSTFKAVFVAGQYTRLCPARVDAA
jgi:hypothetical protein